ncbi:unnamed protein product, partial [Urochloa humidicola]
MCPLCRFLRISFQGYIVYIVCTFANSLKTGSSFGHLVLLELQAAARHAHCHAVEVLHAIRHYQEAALHQVPEVFYHNQKAVLHPTAPLFDQEAQSLKPRCVKALKWIFIICDNGKDGALSNQKVCIHEGYSTFYVSFATFSVRLSYNSYSDISMNKDIF